MMTTEPLDGPPDDHLPNDVHPDEDPGPHLYLVDAEPDDEPDSEPDDEPAPTGDLDEHRRRSVAAIPGLPDGAVLSHVSAACLLDLPFWDVPLLHGPVHATRPRPGPPISRVHLTVRVGRLEPDERTVIGGVPVTTVARTLIDLGRWADLPMAVICTDAALRDGLVTPAELQAALDRAFGTMGVPRARIAVAFSDGRSRSVAESRARIARRWPYATPPIPRFGADHPWPGGYSEPEPDHWPTPYPEDGTEPHPEDLW